MIFPLLYFPPSGETDPFWNDTILFMPLAGSYTCLKGRTTNPRTTYNDATIDGFQCSNTDGFVSHSSLFNLTDSDFTIETYVRTATLSQQRYIFSIYSPDSPYSNPYIRFFFFTDGKLYLDTQQDGDGYGFVSSGSFSFATDTWYHVAVTREGSSWKMWIDGTLQGTLTDSRTFPTSSDLLINIMDGANPGQSRPINNLNGYLHDLRITKACRYTEDFTPPTVPLPTG